MKVVTIGRNAENNDIVVNDEKVSRNHLQMILDDNGNYLVLDLNSTNGTYVNGQRISGQVSLNVTDEVKIGNTVLPWQSYFGGRRSVGMGNPGTTPPSVHKTPVSYGQSKSNPAPKRWLKFVIIGVVVLLLAGGGIAWMILYDKPVDEEVEDTNVVEQPIVENQDVVISQEALNEAEKEAAKANVEYAKAMQKAAEAQAEAERLERIAAQSNSEKDKQAAEQAKKEAATMQKQADKAGKALEDAEKQVASMQARIAEMEKELNQAKADKTNAETAKNNAENSLKLTNKMQEELNGWDEGKALAFCKQKGWNCSSKKDAKNVITKKFSVLDITAKDQVVKEMKKFNPKQKETESTSEKQSTAPTENSTNTSTIQPASTENSITIPESQQTSSESKPANQKGEKTTKTNKNNKKQ